MSTRHPIIRMLVGLAGTALALMLMAAPSYAGRGSSSKAGEARVALSCTSGVKGKLQAKARNGVIEMEFELESGRAGQTWAVSVTDNGTSVYAGNNVTAGPSGEFEVRRRIANQAGTDNIAATATLAGGAGSCSGALSV